MTKKMFQVLVLAAAVWVMNPGTAQASSMTYLPGIDQGRLWSFGSGANAYDFRLVFAQVVTAFSVDVTVVVDPVLTNMPAGYTCVPILGGTNCVLFQATPSAQGWLGSYTITIAWQADTNALYTNDPMDSSGLGRIRILHFDSTGVEDITVPGSYCATCDPDPAIGGKDNNFSDFIVVQAPTVNPNAVVPEPASMVLLGTGLVVLAVGLRRRRV